MIHFKKGKLLYYVSFFARELLRKLNIITQFLSPLSILFLFPIFYLYDSNITSHTLDCFHGEKKTPLVYTGLHIVAGMNHILGAAAYFFVFYFIHGELYTYAVTITTYSFFNGLLSLTAAFYGWKYQDGIDFIHEEKYRDWLDDWFPFRYLTKLRRFRVHPNFVKRVFSIFNVYFYNDDGLKDLLWAKYPASFLPAIARLLQHMVLCDISHCSFWDRSMASIEWTDSKASLANSTMRRTIKEN